MADRHDLWILPLRCPRCGGGFEAGGEDVVYWCGPCRTGWELAGERLVEREVAHAAGFAGEGSRRLPFWVFPFSLATSAGKIATLGGYVALTGNIRQLAPERTGKPPLLIIPAFAAPPAVLQRAARLLTVLAPAFRPAAEKPERIAPIVFREADARTLAEVVILSTITEERRNNLQFLESFAVILGGGRLMTVPFVQREGRIYQPELNLEC